ncbi:SDR family oxidoreductase [Deinococcus psychrotolerans]|uniref:SDR family oxidoreductase n=1 Tax=Deinococcus psychrotolerans TaxID=2489213 RepID=A0A3G8YAV8_9DEIO|nr:SDR family oxidoreductase [Deinococcus psychrotolerans]AZI42205.1 SDR family oxidoreductase [Deinococcus psychrotolerans]
MKIAVIGAAGGVGRQVASQLVQAGHEVRALVRTQEQADMLSLHGAAPVMGDLTGEWQQVLDGTDAVVWAAGAGMSGKYQAIDGDALVNVADTLAQQGPKRLVVVSSMGVDRPEQMPPFLMPVLKVKAVSDAHVQQSGLAFTVVRPGGLSDQPGTGQITLAQPAPRGQIPREDVARVVVACLENAGSIGHTFEIVSGETGVHEAVAAL